jgi:hypothetical protein
LLLKQHGVARKYRDIHRARIEGRTEGRCDHGLRCGLSGNDGGATERSSLKARRWSRIARIQDHNRLMDAAETIFKCGDDHCGLR